MQVSEFAPAENITPDEFLEFINTTDWNANTQRLCLTAARNFQRFVHGDNFPLQGLTIKADEPSPQSTITFNELVKLRACLDLSRITHRQYYVMLAVLWDSWIRASELCRMKIDNLDLIGRKFQVQVKGGRWQWKGITSRTASILESWLDERAKIAKCDRVFINSITGQPFTRDGLRATLYRLCDRAGIPRRSPHSFRRGGLTHRLAEGMSTRLAQIQGGWSDLRQLERYSKTLSIDEIVRYYDDED